MKKDALEKHYRQITSLYDMAEELTATVENESIQDPEAQFVLVEPLIVQLADSADLLTEEFVALCETPARKKSAKNKVEAALRKIFIALEEYKSRLGAKGKKTLAALANIADPIVDKIRKLAEKITLIFMQMVELSLERIMRKHEIDEFYKANEKTAAALLRPSH